MHSPGTEGYRVLTINNIALAGLKILSASCDVSADMQEPQGIIVRSTKVDTDKYDGLLAIARAGVGVDNITVEKATARGIPVFYAPGANANSVNELLYTLLGGCVRNVYAAIEFVKNISPDLDDEAIDAFVEMNKKQFAGSELSEKTLGVIGLGNIGRLVARGALERGMRVVGFDPALTNGQWNEMDPGIIRTELLPQLLQRADIVSVHATLSDKTRHMIDNTALAEMKLGAILVNLARKKICDEVAVLDALNNGKLRAFLTDFPSKRLLRHPKVIATPHLGASTEEAEERSAVMAAKGLADYLQRGIVVNAVNFPTMEMPPKPSTKMRLVIPHKNVPGIIAMISEIISGAGANIGPLHNDTKNGLGCCIADLETPIDDALVEKIRAQDNILKVRTFRF